MDILSKVIKAFFGTKSDKDRKEIQPYVDRILALYPQIDALSNDELRARSAALRHDIAETIRPDEERISELKALLELPDTSLDDKERHSREIDKLTKDIDDKIEQKLDEILPEAFAIMKSTAHRFAENEQVVVTANQFDRDLAAKKDFVMIGNMVTLPQSRNIFDRLGDFYGLNFIVPEHPEYVTAFGAAISCMSFMSSRAQSRDLF